MMYQGKFKKSKWLAVITIAMIIGCAGGEEETTIIEEKAVSVKGQIVSPVNQVLTRSFTGTLEGRQQASIYAKISEAVEKVMVKDNYRVVANQVLVILDKSGPESRYRQAYSVFMNSDKNYNKIKYLYDEGAVSESEYDGAVTSREVARADYEAAAKLVELKSPIDGVVTSVDVSDGDFVTAGQQVATVAQVGQLRMNLGISDKDIHHFNIGDKVTAHVESSEDIFGQGYVSAVAGSADPVTRTFQVEIILENESGKLRPGMFARAEIIVEEFTDILAVPRNATVNRGDKVYVYLVRGDRAGIREVALGAEFNGSAQVMSGLNSGDTVITVGQDYIDDGFKIDLVRFIDSEGKETEL